MNARKISRRAFLGYILGLGTPAALALLLAMRIGPCERAERNWPYSYLIYQKPDGTVEAENGTTGQIEFSSTDAASVIQQAINALPNGGKILIKGGQYTIRSTIVVPNPVVIEGEGPDWYGNHGTYLRAAVRKISVLKFSFSRLMFMPIVRDLQIDCASSTNSGIELGANVSDPIIERVAIHGGVNVLINGALNGWITNCWLESGQYGIRILQHGEGFIITRNHFHNNSVASISAEYSDTDQLQIRDNLVADDLTNSFYLNLTEAHVTGNVIKNAGQSAPNTYDAIVITAIRGPLTIHGNKILGSNTRYGVNVIGDNSNALVSIQNNIFGALRTSPINLSAGLIGVYKIKNNVGYVTENGGIATITAGTTSITVNHGLAKAPSKVIATPQANVGSFWVDNITATSFRIKVSIAPAVDVNFYSSAEI